MIDVSEYLARYTGLITSDDAIERLSDLGERLEAHKKDGGRLLIFGNGASASISSHAALDFTKHGKLETLCFHDPALLTAYSNDYGYENAFKEILISYSRPSDIAVFISTSGESQNMVIACHEAHALGLHTISFTGRDSSNRLRLLSKESFWVDSHAYNIVENTHSIWITTLIDYLVGRAEYEVS